MRAMRRAKQVLEEKECISILQNETHGVLAISGDDGYPYAVPLSYVYDDGAICFHSAIKGHKIDAILKNEKTSFCVVEKDDVIPEEYTTYFRSVIVFGKATIIEDSVEKRASLEKLAAKYSPEQQKGRMQEIDKFFDKAVMIKLSIDHMSGKEAIELMRRRER